MLNCFLEAAYALKTAPSSLSFSILSSRSWQEMYPSENGTRSVRPGGNYRSLRHAKVFGNSNRNFWSTGTHLLFDKNCKRLKVHQKYSAARRIFNSLLSVWICGYTRSFLFDTLLKKNAKLWKADRSENLHSEYLCKNST